MSRHPDQTQLVTRRVGAGPDVPATHGPLYLEPRLCLKALFNYMFTFLYLSEEIPYNVFCNFMIIGRHATKKRFWPLIGNVLIDST